LTARAEALTRPLRRPPLIVLALLLVAAVVGFVAGYRHTTRRARPAAAAAGSVANAGVVLEYPSGWAPASTAPAIPGLSLTHLLALAPGGDATAQGLLSGELAEGQGAPLPSAMLALLSAAPHAEVLSLPGGQAYRYTNLHLRGFGRALELFAIPGAGTSETVLACYGAAAPAPVLRQCERIVAKVTLESQAQNDLNPDTAYAARLAALVTTLDSERVALRRQLGLARRPAQVRAAATKLAGTFATAATSLSALEPPLAAGTAASGLAAALGRARDGYRALATAATSEEPAAYALARERLQGDEAGVDRALERFALIGYGR
jgi:hypothetical protein